LDIGLHKDFDDAGKFRMITEKQVCSIYKQRNPFTHKGHFGHAALVTGSQGLMGAATLAAAACMRSGVGKLTCYVPAIGYQIMQLAVPEAMARISGEEYVVNYDPVFKHESIGTGPGIGFQVKPELLEQIFGCGVPLLLDADILTLLSKHPALLSKIPSGSVMTPHPKEFDRMFGSQVSEFGRINLAIDKANELNIVIVLKGHHTLIALPNAQPCFNTTGNAGMATGGSGDVLAGLITGLLAQGYTSQEAAILGVWLHGHAGDLAAKEISEEAMIAGDIVQYLGKAFQSLSW
jgi:NAD(P)H-hydrate epimerase